MVRWTALPVGVLGVVGLVAVAAGTLPGVPAQDPVPTSARPPVAAAPTAPPLPDPTEAAAPAAPVRSCTNTELGYTLEYPEHWQVADDDPARPCRFFSSTEVGRAPAGSVLPVAEIRVLLAQVPSAELLTALDGSVFEQVTRRDTLVAGSGATVIRYEHPDDPDAGGYVAVLDRGADPAVFVEARERDSADFAATMRVLDAMLLSMEPA